MKNINPLKTNISPENWWFQDEISFSNGLFSGNVLIFWWGRSLLSVLQNAPCYQCTCAIRSFRMSTTRRATYVTDSQWKELERTSNGSPQLSNWSHVWKPMTTWLKCFHCMKQTEVIILFLDVFSKHHSAQHASMPSFPQKRQQASCHVPSPGCLTDTCRVDGKNDTDLVKQHCQTSRYGYDMTWFYQSLRHAPFEAIIVCQCTLLWPSAQARLTQVP